MIIPTETMNEPIKVGKIHTIIHYKGDSEKAGEVGIVVNVTASQPCVIAVYEVKKEEKP